MKKGFLIGCMICIGIYIISGYEKEQVSAAELKSKLLRYHVVANSDNEEDQEIKLKVKAAVLEVLESKLDEATDAEQASEIVEANRELILTTANKVLEKENVSYTASMRLGEEYFPTKIYGDLTLPPGDYNALIIELGNAQGKNWWCVLFPTLCFVEPEFGVLPQESKEKLSGVLTTEEYYSVIEDEETQIKVESKVINWVKDKIA